MLDYEKMKASLVGEKQRLETINQEAENLIPHMEGMDKKIFNKKIADHLNQLENVHAYINDRYGRKELVIYHKNLPYSYNTIFENYQEEICEEKRFSFEKFKAKMMHRINENKKDLTAIEADLADGERRAKEIEYVKDYYKILVKGFSHHIRGKFSRDFEIGWIG